MGSFIAKYFPLYLLWLFFISFVAVSLQGSGVVISPNIPTGVDFGLNYAKNSMFLILDIATFQVSGLPGMITTILFFIPGIPIILWIIEKLIDLLDAVIPF